jgi:hypothetical protein
MSYATATLAGYPQVTTKSPLDKQPVVLLSRTGISQLVVKSPKHNESVGENNGAVILVLPT